MENLIKSSISYSAELFSLLIIPQTNTLDNKQNKWQYRLWGPAQELKITLHIETY